MSDIESAEDFVIRHDFGPTISEEERLVTVIEARDAALLASACEFHEIQRGKLQTLLGLEPRASWHEVVMAVKRLVEEQRALTQFHQWTESTQAAAGECEHCGQALQRDGDGARRGVFVGQKNNDFGWYCSCRCAIEALAMEKALSGEDLEERDD